MVFDRDTFHCKLGISARLVDPDKKEFVYLVLDATNVGAISLSGSENVPLNVANALIKQARCATAADIVSLHFTLTQEVHVVVPISALQQRPPTVTDIDTLLQLGRCDTLTVYVPSDFVDQKSLQDLCEALDQGAIKPSERHLKTLYRGAGGKVITCLDDLWHLERQDSPPPYDPSTVAGASNSELARQSDQRVSTDLRARGKRRTASPASDRNPSKRQSLSDKAAPEPWEFAFATLSAEVATLREQVKQPRRTPGVDAGTQTDSFIEHEPESCLASNPRHSSPSQTSTVENTTEDRLLMAEDRLLDEQNRRAQLDEKVDHINKQIRQELENECFELQCTTEILSSRVDDLQHDLRQETRNILAAKALDLHVKLEGLIDSRIDDFEKAAREKFDQHEKQMKQELESECSGVQSVVGHLETRVDDMENGVQDGLRQEFEKDIETKGLDLQVKLEEFVEHRLEDVEVAVKNDVRMALENAGCKFSIDFCWSE
ncbi:hypothetical protein QM012_008370 [Aureobasidium pullulans]|uniref:Uncharacterized protein n=1 Tax=Aureobasidium pullulans TaxID=5580 RepID=A0ABR0TJA2_AURPU